MKKHHEKVHAFDTIRTYNRVVESIDTAFALLLSKSPDGTDLTLSVDDLKLYISGACTNAKKRHSDIITYITNHESYDLTQHSDKAQYTITNEKPLTDAFADRMVVEVNRPQINSLSKLAAISALPEAESPIMYAAPAPLETPYHYAVMLNDWLDASDYTLRGIDQATGQPLSITDDQKKARVQGMLAQFGNLLFYEFPLELQPDIDNMVAVKNWVIANLNTSNLLDVAQYITDNVEKTPLMRRLWAI
jgi:hypothetical protein